MESGDNGEKRDTTDIWFASYLMLNGYEIADFEIIRKGRGRYFFKIPDEKWKELRLGFNASDVSKVKMHHLSLKDLLY
jgi:hypothetical protein